jgi:hypothetical protein
MYSAVRLTDPQYLMMVNKKSMNLKFVNIVDPTFSKNNLGKSVSKLNYSRIKCGIKKHLKKVNDLYESASLEEDKNQGQEILLRGLLSMFQTTFECIGAHPVLSLMLPQISNK